LYPAGGESSHTPLTCTQALPDLICPHLTASRILALRQTDIPSVSSFGGSSGYSFS